MKTHEDWIKDIGEKVKMRRERQDRRNRAIIKFSCAAICLLIVSISVLGIPNHMSNRNKPTLPATDTQPSSSRPTEDEKAPTTFEAPKTKDDQPPLSGERPTNSPDTLQNTSAEPPIIVDPVPTDTTGEQMPGGVYRIFKTSYADAVSMFSHQIHECTRDDFIEYDVGMVINEYTDNVNDPKHPFCLNLTYVFTWGSITLYDQEKLGSGISVYTAYGSELDFEGNTFIVETEFYETGKKMVKFFPDADRGIAYFAYFSDDQTNVNSQDILKLILSLKIN